MDWKSPFIVYRITPEGKLEEVFHCQDLKKAKYWLTYVAKAGDVCCRTPAHPKHSGKSKAPEYFGHKETSGQASSKPADWEKIAKNNKCDAKFPEEQLTKPA